MHTTEALALAHDLAEYLVDYEPVEEHCLGVQVSLQHTSGDGRKVFVSNQDKKKWHASVSWPSDGGNFYKPDGYNDISILITVSKSRGVQGLARDITRKLLPEYHAHYGECLAKIQKQHDYEAQQITVRDEFLKALEAPKYRLGDRIQDIYVYKHGVYKISVLDGKVELLTSYLPPEVALKMIEVLKESGI